VRVWDETETGWKISPVEDPSAVMLLELKSLSLKPEELEDSDILRERICSKRDADGWRSARETEALEFNRKEKKSIFRTFFDGAGKIRIKIR